MDRMPPGVGREGRQAGPRGKDIRFVTRHLWYLCSLFHRLSPDTLILLPSWSLVPLQTSGSSQAPSEAAPYSCDTSLK